MASAEQPVQSHLLHTHPGELTTQPVYIPGLAYEWTVLILSFVPSKTKYLESCKTGEEGESAQHI